MSLRGVDDSHDQLVVDDLTGSRAIGRRDVLRAVGAGALAFAGAGVFEAVHPVGARARASASGTIKIGFVSPRTGAAAGFGEPDGYMLGLARRALSRGLDIGGTHYSVEIIDKDSQSGPRSAQVANDLINGDKVDLLLATSTPETVNPVSDAAEASGVPCISTGVPWEAWYFGRQAKPSKPQPVGAHAGASGRVEEPPPSRGAGRDQIARSSSISA